MTMSSAPTAELPIVEPLADGPAPEVTLAVPTLAVPLTPEVLTPEVLTGEPGTTAPRANVADSADAVEAVPCRADLRAERRLARRYRRLYAGLGLAVLLGTLGATVVVLDVLH